MIKTKMKTRNRNMQMSTPTRKMRPRAHASAVPLMSDSPGETGATTRTTLQLGERAAVPFAWRAARELDAMRRARDEASRAPDHDHVLNVVAARVLAALHGAPELVEPKRAASVPRTGRVALADSSAIEAKLNSAGALPR